MTGENDVGSTSKMSKMLKKKNSFKDFYNSLEVNLLEISNKLKPFWTDEDCKINPKHIRPFRYWNNANGMCNSNEQDCLHISKSARRYGVINLYDRLTISQLKKWEADGTFKRIYDFILSDKIKHLFKESNLFFDWYFPL